MVEQTRGDVAALVEKLIENASDLIAVIDRDGTISFQSPSVERLLGYQHAELNGMSVFDLVHPDDFAGALIRMQQALTQPCTTRPSVIRLRHRDGSWRAFEAVGTSLLDDPLVRGIVVNAREITERLRLEEELRQTQKMEAIGRLAGGVAHDFNNMLAAIIGFTHLLLQDFEGDDRQRQRLEQVLLASNRAAELTQQLLAFSRRQVRTPEIVDLNVVVDEMRLLLERLIGEDIQLTTVLTPMIGKVRADRGQLEQVILNLAVNARDAMPTGGRLTITTTTKETGKGTGLGLATVHGIVTQNGGSIHLASRAGHGTTFTIQLPRIDGISRTASESQPPSNDSIQGSETILAVEDDGAVRAYVRDVLLRHGYDTLIAACPAEAIAIVEDHTGEIDLLLTDVVMPEMSGRQLSETLTARLPTLRTLYMSGYSDEALGHHGVLDERFALIGKPFTPAALVCKAREVLEAQKTNIVGRGSTRRQ